MGARPFTGVDVTLEVTSNAESAGGFGRLNSASRGWTSFLSSGDEGVKTTPGVLGAGASEGGGGCCFGCFI